LISPNNTININPGNNSLIITDYSENLARMSRIIAALDVSNATDLEIIPLKNGIASEMATLLSRLVEASGTSSAPAAAGADSSFRTTIVAENRSNALIVRAANPARLALVRSLINQLDQAPLGSAGNGAAGNIHVVYLKNADATKLAVTLRAALQANTTGTQAGNNFVGNNTGQSIASAAISTAANASSSPIAASPQPSTGGQIQADPATNSLIITASDPLMRQIKAVIEKLDTRRAQVFVETLIAEVNSDKAAAFGVQWQNALGNTALGTNFGGAGNIASITASVAAGTVSSINRGFNLGVVQKIGSSNQLGFLANFLETTGDGNVLSTPNLLTLDNEEAKIVVGQNVPFLTGQFTNSTSGGATNPFQTIERKDVGITLRIKPQINENGTIKMTIFQEVSSVQASSVNSTSGLVTNKRSIESNVLVEDGSIVVLGGLLQDETSANQERIPGLGNIPFFGALFRSDAKSRKKTNLMVFMRPVIVRDGLSSENLSLSRYEQMRALQAEPSAIPNQFGAITLPENPLLKASPMIQSLPLKTAP
jgi:general secretion pathway protein D